MGADIHWAIERKHPDGVWETVSSKTRVYELGDLSGGRRMPYNHPWKLIGQRNYHLFGILSDVRYPIPNQGSVLAHSDIPDDASRYTDLNFRHENNGDYHSQGYFTLGELREADENDPDGCAPSTEDRKVLHAFRQQVEAVLAGPDALPFDMILFGPEWDNVGEHPEMRGLSNHARLPWAVRAGELLPISGDTLRFVICYDN